MRLLGFGAPASVSPVWRGMRPSVYTGAQIRRLLLIVQVPIVAVSVVHFEFSGLPVWDGRRGWFMESTISLRSYFSFIPSCSASITKRPAVMHCTMDEDVRVYYLDMALVGLPDGVEWPEFSSYFVHI